MKKKKRPAGSGRAKQTTQTNSRVERQQKQCPTVLPVRPAGIPAELKLCDQWVVWRLESRNGVATKVPYDASTGRRAKSNDPATWTSFKHALKTFRRSGGRYDGIAFVFSKDDPFCGVDLDDCRDPATGTVKEWARKILTDLGSYAEVSPSGTGIKVYCKGSLPCERTGTRRPYKTGAVEMYGAAVAFSWSPGADCSARQKRSSSVASSSENSGALSRRRREPS